MSDDPEKMPNFQLMTWTPDGGVAQPLAATSIKETIKVRVVQRERPNRLGAKLDTTGRKCLVWEVDVLFFNGCTEEGIPSDDYYPDGLNSFCATADQGQVGTLKHPRRGDVRCRIETITVHETAEVRDAGAVTIQFWEDNEDKTDLTSFVSSSAAQLPALADSIMSAANDIGIWSDDVAQLGSSIGSLVGLLNSAVDLVDDAMATAQSVIGLCETIADAFAETYDTTLGPGAYRATDPDCSTFLLELRRVQFLAMNAAANAQPTVIEVTYPDVVSIFDVAANKQRDLEEVIDLNTGRFEDMYAIPAGETILIPAAA